MSAYETWLKAEKEWIGVYCKKVIKQTVFLVIPAVAIFMAILLGALAATDKGGMPVILEGAMGGLFLGLIIGLLYLAIMLPFMRPGRYVRKIKSSVKGFSDTEKELLGQEMTKANENQMISYVQSGPNSRQTPARFIVTPHYAFLAGSYPYSIVVKKSEIAQILGREERKTAITRQAKSKTVHYFTLYSIGFYQKDRLKRGMANEELPDEAMGFFDRSIRDRALKLLEQHWSMGKET